MANYKIVSNSPLYGVRNYVSRHFPQRLFNSDRMLNNLIIKPFLLSINITPVSIKDPHKAAYTNSKLVQDDNSNTTDRFNLFTKWLIDNKEDILNKFNQLINK
jgi:hypothetical protein